MSDWIAPDQLARASLFWVVDPAMDLADIAPALQYDIPLLVPETSSVLKQACAKDNYCLFYRTEAEAMACLVYLLSNPIHEKVSG
jgi:hypothetical protein